MALPIRCTIIRGFAASQSCHCSAIDSFPELRFKRQLHSHLCHGGAYGWTFFAGGYNAILMYCPGEYADKQRVDLSKKWREFCFRDAGNFCFYV